MLAAANYRFICEYMKPLYLAYMYKNIGGRALYMEMDNANRHTDKFKMPPKKSTAFKVLIIVFAVLLSVLFGFGIFIWINYQNMTGDLGFDPNDIKEEDSDEGNYPEVTYRGGNVSEISKTQDEIDILLLGVDNRDPSKFTGLSDVIMFMRVDRKNGTLKLASVMRDTLVPIEGHQYNKINAAYNFGGIDLAKKTIKSYLGLVPDYYVVVNFYGMEDLINSLGGVDIELSEQEVIHMNGSIQEINEIDPDNAVSLLKGAGVNHLNGRQAVAYMRLRKVGTDAKRIERQQSVMLKLFVKAKDIGIEKLPAFITSLSGCVRTDIKPAEKMLDIAKVILSLDMNKLRKFRFPDEYEYGSYKKMDIVQPKDYETEMKKLQDFFNEN